MLLNNIRPTRLLALSLLVCVCELQAQSGWKEYSGRNISFVYPADWTLSTEGDRKAVAVSHDGSLRTYEVEVTDEFGSNLAAYFDASKSKYEQMTASMGGGKCSISFRSPDLNGYTPAVLWGDVVCKERLGAPIFGFGIRSRAEAGDHSIVAYTLTFPATDMWAIGKRDAGNVLIAMENSTRIAERQGAAVEGGGPGLMLGHWRSYSIAQTSVDGMYLPRRTYQADFDFAGDGVYNYVLRQTDSPGWTLRLRGHYRVSRSTSTDRNFMGYEMMLTLTPEQVQFESAAGDAALPGLERSRVVFNGFPETTAATFGLHMGSSLLEIKGNSSVALRR